MEKSGLRLIVEARGKAVGRGHVLWSSEKNGHGILSIGHTGHEVYFDESVCANRELFKRGERVRCLIRDIDGVLCAYEVERCEIYK